MVIGADIVGQGRVFTHCVMFQMHGSTSLFCGPGVLESDLAAVRTSANFSQVCFWFVGISTCEPVRKRLMDDYGGQKVSRPRGPDFYGQFDV